MAEAFHPQGHSDHDSGVLSGSDGVHTKSGVQTRNAATTSRKRRVAEPLREAARLSIPVE
jgi:hypothetical protein